MTRRIATGARWGATACVVVAAVAALARRAGGAGPQLTAEGVQCDDTTFRVDEVGPSVFSANALRVTQIVTMEQRVNVFLACQVDAPCAEIPGYAAMEDWRRRAKLLPWPSPQDPKYIYQRILRLQDEGLGDSESRRAEAHMACLSRYAEGDRWPRTAVVPDTEVRDLSGCATLVSRELAEDSGLLGAFKGDAGVSDNPELLAEQFYLCLRDQRLGRPVARKPCRFQPFQEPHRPWKKVTKEILDAARQVVPLRAPIPAPVPGFSLNVAVPGEEGLSLLRNFSTCPQADVYLSPTHDVVRHSVDLPLGEHFSICADTASFAVDQPLEVLISTPAAQQVEWLWPGEPKDIHVQASTQGWAQVAHIEIGGYPRRELLRALARNPTGPLETADIFDQKAQAAAQQQTVQKAADAAGLAKELQNLASTLTKDHGFDRALQCLDTILKGFKGRPTVVELSCVEAAERQNFCKGDYADKASTYSQASSVLALQHEAQDKMDAAKRLEKKKPPDALAAAAARTQAKKLEMEAANLGKDDASRVAIHAMAADMKSMTGGPREATPEQAEGDLEVQTLVVLRFVSEATKKVNLSGAATKQLGLPAPEKIAYGTPAQILKQATALDGLVDGLNPSGQDTSTPGSSPNNTPSSTAEQLCSLTSAIVPLVSDDILIEGRRHAEKEPYVLVYDFAGGFQLATPGELWEDRPVFVIVRNVAPGWSVSVDAGKGTVVQRDLTLVGLSSTVDPDGQVRTTEVRNGLGSLQPFRREVQPPSTHILSIGFGNGDTRRDVTVCASRGGATCQNGDVTPPASPSPGASGPAAPPAGDAGAPSDGGAGADTKKPSAASPAPEAHVIGRNSVVIHKKHYLGVRAGVGATVSYGGFQDLGTDPNSGRTVIRAHDHDMEASVPLLATLYPCGRDTTAGPAHVAPNMKSVVCSGGFVGGLDILQAFTATPRFFLGGVLDLDGFGLTVAASYERWSYYDGAPGTSFPAGTSVPADYAWRPGLFVGLSMDADFFEAIFKSYFAQAPFPAASAPGSSP